MQFTAKNVAATFGLLGLLMVQTAQASLMRESFLVEVLAGGPAAGETGNVVVEYDGTFVPEFGDFTLLGDEFVLTLDLFGQTFTNNNDIGFDILFPNLTFFDRSVVFIDFVVNEFYFFNPTPINDPRIEEFGGGDVANGTWFVTTFGPEFPEEEVPVPATLALMLVGLLGAGRVRRQRASRA